MLSTGPDKQKTINVSFSHYNFISSICCLKLLTNNLSANNKNEQKILSTRVPFGTLFLLVPFGNLKPLCLPSRSLLTTTQVQVLPVTEPLMPKLHFCFIISPHPDHHCSKTFQKYRFHGKPSLWHLQYFILLPPFYWTPGLPHSINSSPRHHYTHRQGGYSNFHNDAKPIVFKPWAVGTQTSFYVLYCRPLLHGHFIPLLKNDTHFPQRYGTWLSMCLSPSSALHAHSALSTLYF